MYLFYIDESGNTGGNLNAPDQPIHWLVALGAPPSAVMHIETELLGIAGRYFGPRARESDFELHGADIFSGREPDFRRLSVPDRVRLYEEILNLIGRHDAYLFIRGIDKEQHRLRGEDKGYIPDHPHRLGFMYLVEQIDVWLEELQDLTDLFEETHESVYGLLVADEQREMDRDLISGFAVWRQYGTDHGYRARHIRHLIDTVHFVPSQDSWLIQLVDCVAFIRNRYARIVREHGAEVDSYSRSDKAVARLWLNFCQPHVVDERVWP